MTRNPVAKNNRHRGGPFKNKDKEGRSYRQQKIQKEVDLLDKRYIEEELKEFEDTNEIKGDVGRD